MKIMTDYIRYALIQNLSKANIHFFGQINKSLKINILKSYKHKK